MSEHYDKHWGDLSDLIRILDVEPAGPGQFTAPLHLNAPRNVVEGSQMLAQAVVAAARQVPEKRVISAYAQFSRVAVFDKPLNFNVDVLQSGRNFASLAVNAEQAGKLRSAAMVLMDRDAPDYISHQVAMPVVPGPEECPPFDYGMPGRDVRFVNGDYTPHEDRLGPPVLHCWMRCRGVGGVRPDDRLMHQALLTQPVGHFTIGASLLPHAGVKEGDAHLTLSTGIMSIAIAYHAEADVSDWILYSNPSIWAGRGLVQGHGTVFSRAGTLLASYTVTGMVRPFDKDAPIAGIAPNQLM